MENNFVINGYEFNMTMAYPLDLFGEEDDGESEEIWPDISDNAKWGKVNMSGAIINTEELFQAKYIFTEGNEVTNIYIKDNTIYMNSSQGKYKLTLDSKSEIDEYDIASSLPSSGDLMEQIDLVSNATEGLKFEKAIEGNKLYYHVSGVAKINESQGGISLDMEYPIDLYLTFENDKLVSYKYKTFLLFVYTELEISAVSTSIEFPQDLDTYIEDEEIFNEE